MLSKWYSNVQLLCIGFVVEQVILRITTAYQQGEEAGHSRIDTSRIGISLVLQVGVEFEFCLVILVILGDFAIYAGTHTA
jgi:hypothetical protein